jgi:hypothetical protein
MNDERALDDLTAAFFRAFISKDLGPADLSALSDLFLPDARIIKTCGARPEAQTLAEFIAPRARLLSDGTLVGFHEEEVSGRTEIFGDVAHRFCVYRKRGALNGVPFDQRGMKSIQFVRTHAGWKISALAWDDERDGLDIPARYAEMTDKT